MDVKTTGSFFKERNVKLTPSLVRQPAFPKNALVELTNTCNHACVFCNSGSMARKFGRLPKNVFTRFVREGVSLGLSEVGLYSTGEPFMEPDLEWFVAEAKRAGIQRIYITTNGALASLEKMQKLVAAGLASIKYSINAGSRKTYKLIHGHDDFEAVMENLREVHDWKVRNSIDLQMLGSMVYTSLTEAEIETHRTTLSPYLEDIAYIRAVAQGGQNIAVANALVEQRLPTGPIKPCGMVFNRAHLTCEGYLTACCIDYENNLTYADYNNGLPLADSWNNSTAMALRQRHLDGDFAGLLCAPCLTGKPSEFSALSDLRGGRAKKNSKRADLDRRNDEHQKMTSLQ